jgi:hypothetical protein
LAMAIMLLRWWQAANQEKDNKENLSLSRRAALDATEQMNRKKLERQLRGRGSLRPYQP